MWIHFNFAFMPELQVNLIKLIFINHMLDILPRTQCGVPHILHLPEHLRPPTGVMRRVRCRGFKSRIPYLLCSPDAPSPHKRFASPQHPWPKRSTAIPRHVNGDSKARSPGPPRLTSQETSGKFSTGLPLSFITSKVGRVPAPTVEACCEM